MRAIKKSSWDDGCCCREPNEDEENGGVRRILSLHIKDEILQHTIPRPVLHLMVTIMNFKMGDALQWK